MFKLLGSAIYNRARRARLRQSLEDPRFSEGRTLDALRMIAGEADTDEGREHTRELLRGVKRGRRYARILKRDVDQAEMWGLRDH